MSEQHPDVSFHVYRAETDPEAADVRTTFAEATRIAVHTSIANSTPMIIDVVVDSEDGAVWWAGRGAGGDGWWHGSREQDWAILERIELDAATTGAVGIDREGQVG